jgi:hypothetical protein
VLREMWSGLVVCGAMLVLCVVSLATVFPYVKLSEALLQHVS